MHVTSDLLDVAVDVEIDALHIRLTGKICLLTLPILRGALDGLLASGDTRDVVVDLSGVTMIGSAGAELLASTATLLGATGATMGVVGSAGLVREVLLVLGNDWLLADLD